MKSIRFQIWMLCALAVAIVISIQIFRKSSSPSPKARAVAEPTIANTTREISQQPHDKPAAETIVQPVEPAPLQITNVLTGHTATSPNDEDTETARLRARIVELEQSLALVKSNTDAARVATASDQPSNAIPDVTNLVATTWVGTNTLGAPNGTVVRLTLTQETSDQNPQPRLRIKLLDWPYDWREAPLDELPNGKQNGVIGVATFSRPQPVYYILRQDYDGLWLARVSPVANHKGAFREILLTRVTP